MDDYGKALSNSFARIYNSHERVDETAADIADRRLGYRLEVYLNIRDLLHAPHDVAFAIVYGKIL